MAWNWLVWICRYPWQTYGNERGLCREGMNMPIPPLRHKPPDTRCQGSLTFAIGHQPGLPRNNWSHSDSLKLAAFR
jgi:hypothetical protein